MRTIICIYCQLPFNAPALDCPNCGSAVDPQRAGTPPVAANQDQVIELEDLDEDFEIVPLGADEGMRFESPASPKPKKVPPSFPGKHIARA
jgi:hypothetical protein